MSGIQEEGGDMEMQDAPALLPTAKGKISDENTVPGSTGTWLIVFVTHAVVVL